MSGDPVKMQEVVKYLQRLTVCESENRGNGASLTKDESALKPKRSLNEEAKK